MNSRSIFYRLIALILCLSLILSVFIVQIPTVFAETTDGTEEHIADDETLGSYRNLIALRDESRRAGRVWADKSVFTDDITLNFERDGYDGSISNDGDFLHVFSALGSSQQVETKEIIPLDVVFILDFSVSMGIYSGTKDNSRIAKTVNAVNKAINTLLSINSDSRVAIAVYAETGYVFLPLLNLVPGDPTVVPKWLTIEEHSTSYYFRVGLQGNAREAVWETTDSGATQAGWSEVKPVADFCGNTTKVTNELAWKNNTTEYIGVQTNLQAGLAAGMQLLANEEITTWTSPRTEDTYERIPVTIIMTDGESNRLCTSINGGDHADAWYQTDIGHAINSYNDESVKGIAPILLSTLMTGAYYKALIRKNYLNYDETAHHIYGVGIDIGTQTTALQKIHATFEAGKYFNGDVAKHRELTGGIDANDGIIAAYDAYQRWYNSASTVAAGKIYGTTDVDEERIEIKLAQLSNDKKVTKADIAENINFCNVYVDVNTENANEDIFAELIVEVMDEIEQVFVPVEGFNDVGVDSMLTYVDPIGKYMEVTSVKHILLFGKLYNVSKSEKVEYFDRFDHEITDPEEIENGIYAYAKHYYEIEVPDDLDGIILNPCYGRLDTDFTFDLSDIKIYVKKSGNYIDPDVEGGGMESDTGYDEALHIDIPAIALPMQVATILVENGTVRHYATNVGDIESLNKITDKTSEEYKEKYEEYLSNKKQSTPLRVFYEVGIAEEIKTPQGNVDLTMVNPDYIVNNMNDAGDKVYFYSNWYKANEYKGYVTDGNYTYGDAALTFSPSENNRYYIFEDARLLYKILDDDTDHIGGKVAGSIEDGWMLNGKKLEPVTDISDEKDEWVYVLIEYYDHDSLVHYALPRLTSEFGEGIGGSEGRVTHHSYLCWYNPNAETEAEKYVDFVVPDGNGGYKHMDKPGGEDSDYVIAAKKGALRVGDMAAGIGVKGDVYGGQVYGDNKTGTSATYYMPTISASTEGQSSDDVIINLYLGNNGRLSVHDTQLLVTKTVLTEGEYNEVLRNMEFQYTIELEGRRGTYNAIKTVRETVPVVDKDTGEYVTDEETGEPKTETIWRALIKTVELLTNNQGLLEANDGQLATVGLDGDGKITDGKTYYIYVGGVSRADHFTHTLFDYYAGHSFTEFFGMYSVVTVEEAYLLPVDEYDPSEADAIDPEQLEKVEKFPIGQVVRDTVGFAIHTDYLCNTTYLTEELQFNSDNMADFTLRDGEGLLFIGLRSGASYTVTEKLTAGQVAEGISLNRVEHQVNVKEKDREDRKVTRVYSGGTSQDAFHDFNDTDHTYSVSGDTTPLFTEEVNFFNYPPKTHKEQITPEGGYVDVGDTVEYVLYWANDMPEEENEDPVDITITDPLDWGVDFVKAEFVKQNDDGSYEEIPEAEWKGNGWTYKTHHEDDDENKRVIAVEWTITGVHPGDFGFVRLTVQVNDKASFAFDENGAPLGTDNMITNKGRVVFNEHEFSTDTVKTPLEGIHKTEISVKKPGEPITNVGSQLGNLIEDAASGNAIGPQVDVGWEIGYRITYKNRKTETATVTVADRLDPDVFFVSARYGEVTLTAESSGDEIEKTVGDVTIKYDKVNRMVVWVIRNVDAGGAGDVYLNVQVRSSALGGLGEDDPGDEGGKVFKKYNVPVGKPLEQGTYILVYNGKALSNHILTSGNISSLSGTPVKIEDDIITVSDSEDDKAILWNVVSAGSSTFYLQSEANGSYLKIGANVASFVEQASATKWQNYTGKSGVLKDSNANVYFGYYSSDFRGVTMDLFANGMTFYKLEETGSAGPGTEDPDADKVFEPYDVKGKTVLEEGTYIFASNVYGGNNALSSTRYGTLTYALKCEEFTIEDGVITNPADTIMWTVEVPENADYFYLKTAEGKYLKGEDKYSGAISFVDNSEDATKWVIASGKKDCLGLKDSSSGTVLGVSMMGYCSITSSPSYQMTYYKLKAPDLSDTDAGADIEEYVQLMEAEGKTQASGDRLIHNTAGVISVVQDAGQTIRLVMATDAADGWEITETVVNPLDGMTKLTVIEKSGQPNETFVYRITGETWDGDRVDLTVTVNGVYHANYDKNQRSATILLPPGTYTVVENPTWSWRYDNLKTYGKANPEYANNDEGWEISKDFLTASTSLVHLSNDPIKEHKTVIYEHVRNDKVWLGGENHLDNRFADTSTNDGEQQSTNSHEPVYALPAAAYDDEKKESDEGDDTNR